MVLPDHTPQQTGKNTTPPPPWAWCEVILITPRSWPWPSWLLQKLALFWPESRQMSSPWLSYWWHYHSNRVYNQKSTNCVEAIQSVWNAYWLFITSQLLFNLLFLYSDPCPHLNLLVEQKCMVLFAVFPPEHFNIFIMMLWYSMQSSYFHHCS